MNTIEIIATIIFIVLGTLYTINVNKAKKESKYCCSKGCPGCAQYSKLYIKNMN